MKLTTALLVVSLAANGGLLAVFAFKPALAPPSVRDFFAPDRGSSAAPATAVAPTAPAAREPAGKPAAGTQPFAGLWAALQSDDLPTLVARLRAAGFSRTVVRSIVNARLEERFSSRFAEVMAPYPALPFWKPDPMHGLGAMGFYEQYNQIYRERSRALRELLGNDAFYGGDPTAAQRRQFGNLSPAKIDLVQRIADDYAEMTSQIKAAMQGLSLPDDREKLALLEREKRADLAAILTPAEREDYEMRSSPLTMRLRTGLTIMDASEQEFRTIFRIQQQFSDAQNTDVGFITPEMNERRQAAQKQQAEKLKAVLGDARYAEYARATNPEYQQLYRITQRENISLDTAERAFALRDRIAEQSTQIAGNASLDADAKRAALKVLAQNTRTQMIGILGPTAGNAYAQSARWLTYVENGSAVTIDSTGNTSYRMVSIPRR
ncbi:MAG: hypothetical protein Q7S40_17915 [Opitutaceae bacterium]|nr:hypothetical protein [Opitutaceae bacterium]